MPGQGLAPAPMPPCPLGRRPLSEGRGRGVEFAQARADGDARQPGGLRDAGDPTPPDRSGLGRRPESPIPLDEHRLKAGELWRGDDLVFTTGIGTMMSQHNIRRDFRKITIAAGLGDDWVPRELRHTFVSILSAGGAPVEEIARVAGHRQTSTTELVYRRELRPVIATGAELMDKVFSRE